jgi:hypothetical protein
MKSRSGFSTARTNITNGSSSPFKKREEIDVQDEGEAWAGPGKGNNLGWDYRVNDNQVCRGRDVRKVWASKAADRGRNNRRTDPNSLAAKLGIHELKKRATAPGTFNAGPREEPRMHANEDAHERK